MQNFVDSNIFQQTVEIIDILQEKNSTGPNQLKGVKLQSKSAISTRPGPVYSPSCDLNQKSPKKNLGDDFQTNLDFKELHNDLLCHKKDNT